MNISYPPAVRRQLLSKHFLMSSMPERALDELVKFSTVARFEPHQDIFNKGDPGDCLYGVLSGRVRIYSTSAEGSEIMLNVMEAGELFGEIALLDGRPRTASAAAMERGPFANPPRSFPALCQGQSGHDRRNAFVSLRPATVDELDD